MKKLLKRTLWGLLLLVLLALGGGAVTLWPFLMYPVTDITLSRVDPLPVVDSEFMLGGVAERDITPPIGIPKMGYSAWARDADGFRNRLKVRAFYLKPRQGQPLLVLQADLPASSLVLQHEIARRVASQTDVAMQNLSLHVTHTHSGPGQFMDSDFYNAFGSNQPGFDPQLFEFLASQMTEAVIAAYESRRPAKIAIGTTAIYGATRNRAIGAYVRNQNVSDKQEDDAAALRAINPLITLVRIDALTDNGDYKPLGAFSTFAVHGTGIPPFTHPYHGDVWAFFERDLANRIERFYHTPWKPVHGPFEANHGDNNPNYRQGLRGEIETRRIGLALADRAWQLFESLDDHLQDDVVINSAQREIDLLNLSAGDDHGLCERAIAGTAVVGAAQGDEVFPISYMPPFQHGWPDDGSGDCQAEKRWMLGKLQAWGMAPGRYPHRLSISGFQVGSLAVVGLPFEVTFEAGNRIERAIATAYQTAQQPVEHIVVSSHTNGFFGYSATREEYSAQWYEGGHTLYGPNTTRFLATESARLMGDMLRQPGYAELPEHWTFALMTHTFYPPSTDVLGKRVELRSPVFHAAAANQEPYWEWQVLDVDPASLDLHLPLMSVEVSDDGEHFFALLNDDGVAVDDEGCDLQIQYDGNSDAGMARYFMRWFNPHIAPPGRWYRFRLAARTGQEGFHSSRFR